MSNKADRGGISSFDNEEKGKSSEGRPEKRRIGEVIELIKGKKPTEVLEEKKAGAVPYLVVETMTDGSMKYTTETDLPKAKEKDIVMIMDGSKSGRCYYGNKGVVGSTMAVLKPEGINPFYLNQLLTLNFNRLNSATRGSAVPHTDKDLLRSLEIIDFPISEQRRIASVLYNVDQAIKKTEEIIEQTQRVKKGLMQDLFTEGYYKHEEFEEHQIFGKYPVDWKLSSIGELAEEIPGGGTPKKSNDEYWGGNIPWATVKDFNGPRLSKTKDYITERGLEESSTNLIPENSIITSTRMGLGRAFINDVEMAINQDMKAIITTDEVTTEYLLFWIFNISDYIESIGRGTTVKGLSLAALKSIDVPLPAKKEQKKIVESLSKFYSEKDILEKEKEQLQSLKKGLMQDLLTGEVRTDESVEVLDEVVEVEC